MKKLFTCAAMAMMIALAWGAEGAQTSGKKTSEAKKTATKAAPAKKSSGSSKAASTSGAHKRGSSSGKKSASAHGKTAPAKRATTWRNRQTAPSADRYREIQEALVAKGYLNPEDANGAWNQASADAMKKFQAEQNIESSGKINSLSLIALGLGPRRDVTATPKPPEIPGPGQ